MVLPVFYISGLHHLSDDVQKLGVINLFLQQSHKDIMVNIVEVAFDVELDEPLCTCPVLDILECGVT